MQQRKRGFTTEEAARYIGRSKSYLDHLRITGPRHDDPGIPYIRVGRTVLYLKEDLDAWLDQFPRRLHLAEEIHGRLAKHGRLNPPSQELAVTEGHS
jgi:excisionase family DNA binding protein